MAYQERGLMEIELCAEDILRLRFNPQGDFRPCRSWTLSGIFHPPKGDYNARSPGIISALDAPGKHGGRAGDWASPL